MTVVNNSNRRIIALSNNRVKSDELFRDCKELTIIHNSEEYRLRLTGNGKLILTK